MQVNKEDNVEVLDVSKLDINPWQEPESIENKSRDVPVPLSTDDHEESEAHNPWVESYSHPRSPTPPILPEKDQSSAIDGSPSPPQTPAKDEQFPPASPPDTAASNVSSGFPSLSTIARSFTIPSLSRSRPTSVDIDRGTPATLPAPSPDGLNEEATSAPSPPPSSTSTTPRSITISDTNEVSNKLPEDSPFDFQKFLEQMNTRSADPVSKYLKSFLSNFAKRTFTVNDQIKIINDFLNFIATRMRECDVWKRSSDADFDNAMEGMEKLVMNRLYDFTFTPQIAKTIPPRPILTDDLERDHVLSQRISLFAWIEEKHLDIHESEGSKGFLLFAQQELLKINHYKAPRDKVICILNCCKVIFGLIRHVKMDEGADAFVPILIFVVLKANPEHILSNVEFINRFRNPAKLQSEAGYYLSSLMGAVSFIETMDHSSLSNITQEEFERSVEHIIQNLPQSNQSNSPSSNPALSRPTTPLKAMSSTSATPRTPHAGEESAQPLALPSPSAAQTFTDDARRIFQKTGDTISKPINVIGKIFNDALDTAEAKLNYIPGTYATPQDSEKQQLQQQQQSWQQYPGILPSGSGEVTSYPQTPVANMGGGIPYNPPPIQTPYKPRVRKSTPSRAGSPASMYFDQSPDTTPSRPAPQSHPTLGVGRPGGSLHPSRTPTPNLDLEAVQAEINQATEHAVTAARETLKQMFPTTEDDVISLVLEANDNDLGRSIDKLLEVSSGT